MGVFGADKAAKNTGLAIRLANRKHGNSSNWGQLLVAFEDAAECHENFTSTFFKEDLPLRCYLQSLVYHEYQMIVAKLSGQEL